MPENLVVDPYVQQHVVLTNGNLYRTLLNGLPRYPIPKWPLPRTTGGEFSLDIGCGWGRWLVSAGNAGYLPVGIDIQTERLLAARRVMAQHRIRGYVVAADLQRLPFRSAVFHKAFSYSVLQHAHRAGCAACIGEVFRILRPGGECCLEFPVSHGMANWRFQFRKAEPDDPDSWHVRYYSRKEIRKTAAALFQDVELETDCFLGIGVRPEDVDLLPWRYKCVVWASETLKTIARGVPPLRWLSDSIYVRGRKPAGQSAPPPVADPRFSPEHNLWILPWLVCPVTGHSLEYDDKTHSLLSSAAGLRYSIQGDVPVLIASRAKPA